MPESTNPVVPLGDRHARDELFQQIHGELRKLAEAALKQERPDHTLQPTALVNEVYLKMIAQTRAQWQDRQHFFALAAGAIRRILVDHAKAKNAAKRGGEVKRRRVELEEIEVARGLSDEQLLDLDEALNKLTALHPRQAKVVELKFFGTLENLEVANELGVSERTVNNEWNFAKAWLKREFRDASKSD